MEYKILKSIIIYFSISIYFIAIPERVSACLDVPSDDYYRMIMFRAEVPQILRLQEFYYSLELYNHIYYNNNNRDINLNIKEWQTEMGADVTTNDIEFIIYKTHPDLFVKSYENKSPNPCVCNACDSCRWTRCER